MHNAAPPISAALTSDASVSSRRSRWMALSTESMREYLKNPSLGRCFGGVEFGRQRLNFRVTALQLLRRRQQRRLLVRPPRLGLAPQQVVGLGRQCVRVGDAMPELIAHR